MKPTIEIVFYSVLLLSIVFFLVGEAYWFLRRMRPDSAPVPLASETNSQLPLITKPIDFMWSLIPALILLLLTLVQSKQFITFSKTEAPGNRPVVITTLK